MITELLGVTCIWSNQDGIKPTGSFASLNLSPARSLGTEVRRSLEIQKIVEVKEYTLSIDAFDTDVSSLWQQLNKTSVLAECVSNNVAFRRIANITDLSSVLDNRTWEKRINISFIISTTDYIDDDNEYIESVSATGSFTNSTEETEEETEDSTIVSVEIESEVK